MKIFKKMNFRMDMEKHFIWRRYEKAVQAANEYIDIEGVEEYLDQAENDYNKYETNLYNYLQNEKESEIEKFNVCDAVMKKHNKCLIIGLIIIAFRIILAIIEPETAYNNGFLNVLHILLGIAIFAFVLVFVVLRIRVIIAEKKYRAYAKKVLEYINAVNAACKEKIDAIEKDVDEMFLASLTPKERREEMWKREQREYNQKLVAGQEEIVCGQARMVQEQRAMVQEQKAMVQEQKDTNRIQQGILSNLNQWREEWKDRY